MATKKVIIYGGRGALGSTCVAAFKSQKWWVGSIDMGVNEQADANITINCDHSLVEQNSSVVQQVQSALNGDQVDAIICVAGGWAGGNSKSEDFVKNCDLMWKQSVFSSVIASSLAAKVLKTNGFLSLTGACAALEPTPGMIGYGMAKAGVHHLTKSLAASEGGLPSNSCVVSILPVTLDTPMNRKWMPNADTTTWTPLDFISKLFIKWSNNEERPPTGSLVKLVTKSNNTQLEIE